MSFSFFKPSRPKTPLELVKAVRESLIALDAKTVAEVKALEKALEEVEKSICALRTMISGDGEVEPNPDQVSQLAVEICKEGVLDLFIHKLPILGWECSFRYILESTSFELFFKYVELPTFDVATDAFSTFKDLLTKHELAVSEFLSSHYEQFFELYERLLTSINYATRRQSLKLLSEFLLEPPNSQSMKRYILEVRYLKVMMTLLKDSSKNIQISAFHIFKVFVANPNKPPEIMAILAKNSERLITLLNNLPLRSEDEQLEEEKEMIVKEMERISSIPGIIS
ncbi:uncharacterized protein [Aristolochia californica]|uniref:uncharacterized protein isoform X2 n=1 Tax=Aristolochia californica TaxID=171875 RepID=UPI0035D64BFF